MSEHVLLRLVAIVVLGISAQWVAWRVNLPSILLLLLTGIVAGPVTGFLDPDAMFGELLVPLVSIAVAVILYEGGLSLSMREFRQVGGVVGTLSTLGAAVTWIGGSAAVWLLFDVEVGVALVLGALFVVTGPTVVGPLLRHIRPTGSVGPILKWEGIVTDPLGAALAVLLFETLLSGDVQHGSSPWAAALKTLGLGSLVGVAAALVLAQLLRRHLLPDFLHNTWSLMLLFVAYAGGEWVQHEAGLLSVTVMGFVLANKGGPRIRHIIEFKEDLRVLLISSLFIVLAARIQPSTLASIGLPHVAFVLVLILVVRPVSVLTSTLRGGLTWREKVFLMCVAPRGIVSAAVASVLGLELMASNRPEGALFVPIAFSVIIGTVTVYGLGAPVAARWLKLAQSSRDGFLILGAHAWARAVATQLQASGVRLLLVDTNRRRVSKARLEGLPAVYGNVLSEHVVEDLDLTGIGRFLALTRNDEVNALACMRMEEVFGRAAVFRLGADEGSDEELGEEFSGRRLFGPDVTFTRLDLMRRRGGVVKVTGLTDEFSLEDYRQRYGEGAVELFVLRASGRVEVITGDGLEAVPPGDSIVSVVLEPTVVRDRTSTEKDDQLRD